MGTVPNCPLCGKEGFELHADLYTHINSCEERGEFTPEEAKELVPLPEPPSPPPVPVSERKRGPRPCLCGCGDAISSRRGTFLPGHDAKLKAKVANDLRGTAPAKDVTPEAWAYAKSKWSHLIPELKEYQP